MDYLVLQGIMQVAVVTAGVPGAFVDVGDVSNLEFGFKVDSGSHTEHRTGKRLEDAKWTKKTEGTITAALDTQTRKQIALLFRGVGTSVTGASVTNEPIAAALPAVGDVLRLPDPKVSALVITDSSAGPKTLAVGTNYKADLDFAEIEILNTTTGGPFVAPLKAAYTFGSHERATLMTQSAKEYWVRFKGINDDGQKILVEFYRWAPDPGDKMSLVTEDVVPSQWVGKVLADLTKEADPELGPFGRVMFL